jgi:hypothetical protein
MQAGSSSRFSVGLVISIGLMLIALGVTTVIYPEIMTRYGIATSNVHAKSTIMALIGGAEIGLGLFVLFGQKIGVTVAARLVLLSLLFAGILIARLLAAFLFFPELPSVFFREALAELLIVGLLAIGIYRSKKRKH